MKRSTFLSTGVTALAGAQLGGAVQTRSGMNKKQMSFQTPVCELLGIRYPIVQAGMPGVAGPELVAAVSNAGGLGILPATMVPPESLREQIRGIRRLTTKPFGVNLLLQQDIFPPRVHDIPDETIIRVHAILNRFRSALGIPHVDQRPPAIPPLIAAAFEIILEEQIPVFSIGLGNPSAEMVSRCRERGIKIMAMICTVEDALTLAEGGADVIVAQGSEAGGHRSTWVKKPSAQHSAIGILPLVSQVAASVDVPVLAAGGISTARDVVAAMYLGAQGALMGTRFVASAESLAPINYKQQIIDRSSDETVITDTFTGMYARVLRNTYTEEYTASGAPVLPPGVQLMAVNDILRAAGSAGRMEYSALYCGQGIDHIKSILPAGVIVEELARKCQEILSDDE